MTTVKQLCTATCHIGHRNPRTGICLTKHLSLSDGFYLFTMAGTRDWKDVLSSCSATVFFSITAYCLYGSIIHRSTWDRQNLYLPLLFLLFPEIFICQTFMNTILIVQRYRCMRRLRVPRDAEGFWFYVCGILDLHSKHRKFEPRRHFIAHAGGGGSYEQKSEGNWRLSTLNSSRLSYHSKYRTKFDGAKYFAQLGFTLILLYQGVSACITYIGRCIEIENGILGMDHLTGIYAICGTILELATLVIILQPYDWTDNNIYIERKRWAMPDVDTSNAWVYEGFLAVVVHSLNWISLRSWIFFSTPAQLNTPSQSLQYNGGKLFVDIFSRFGIAVFVLVCIIGVPLMIPTIGEVISRPSRHGMVWLARRTHISYYAGGITFRLTLAAVSLVVALMIWIQAAEELVAVERGQMKSWNAAWEKPNPCAQTVYGAFLSLWANS